MTRFALATLILVDIRRRHITYGIVLDVASSQYYICKYQLSNRPTGVKPHFLPASRCF